MQLPEVERAISSNQAVVIFRFRKRAAAVSISLQEGADVGGRSQKYSHLEEFSAFHSMLLYAPAHCRIRQQGVASRKMKATPGYFISA